MDQEQYLILQNQDPQTLAKEVTHYLNLNQGWATHSGPFITTALNNGHIIFYQAMER